MNASEEPDEDPLRHADIGDTHTIEREKEIYTIDLEPAEFRGTDRITDTHITNTQVTTDDEYGDEKLVVTIQGTATKTLPRRWDTCREPRTSDEHQTARRNKWRDRALNVAAGFVIPFVLATAVGMYFMTKISGELSVNGEPVTVGGPMELLPAVLLLFIMTGTLWYGLHRALPRHPGGIHR